MTVDEGKATAVMRRKSTLAFAFVVAVTAAVLGYYHDRFWWPSDEGVYAHVADRVARGEVLNRDVQNIHPGYHAFANALSLVLFGDDLVSLRYPLVAMGLVQSCLIFFLVIRRGTLVAITASVSLTALSYVQFLNPTANWYGLFLVIVVICVLSWRPQDGRWRLEALGFLVVTLLMVRQLTGVIVAIGVVTYLIGEAQCGASVRDRLLARALVATMACGLGAYLLLMTDPLVTLMFGIWPLGILVWVWRSAAANREVLGILARLALGGIIAAAPLLLYHIVYGSLVPWLADGIGAAGSLNELEFMRRMTYATLVIMGVREAADRKRAKHGTLSESVGISWDKWGSVGIWGEARPC